MSMSIRNNILKGSAIDLDCPSDGIGWMIYNSCEIFPTKTCHISHVGPSTRDYKPETFASFKNRSTRVAKELLRYDAQPKDVVVNCSPNNYDNALTTAACFYIGVIPANLDPSLSDRECGHLLEMIQPKFIFVHKDSVPLIQKGIKLSGITTQLVIQGCDDADTMDDGQCNFLEFLIRDASDFQPRKVNDVNETCIIFFSSGSTGFSKGICISHRAFFLGSITFMDMLENTACMLHYSTFYWSSGIMLFLGSFIFGVCRVGGLEFTPESFCKLVEDQKITSVFLASPVAYQMDTLPKFAQMYDIKSLKTIIFGGGPIGAEQITKLRKWFPEINIFIGYGMSEIGGAISGFNKEDKKVFLDYPSSCGRPLREMLVKFADTESGEALPPGKIGELLIKPPTKMNLYYRGAENSDTLFDSEGFFKTGDLGYYDKDGLLFVCDRIREMFKYMSFHIVPAAIEVVLKQHPAVKECIVFGVPDEVAENLPAAAVVIKPNFDITEDEIGNFVNGLVIDREKLCGGVFFVEEFPKTASGKIRRVKLKEDMIAKIDLNKGCLKKF